MCCSIAATTVYRASIPWSVVVIYTILGLRIGTHFQCNTLLYHFICAYGGCPPLRLLPIATNNAVFTVAYSLSCVMAWHAELRSEVNKWLHEKWTAADTTDTMDVCTYA